MLQDFGGDFLAVVFHKGSQPGHVVEHLHAVGGHHAHRGGEAVATDGDHVALLRLLGGHVLHLAHAALDQEALPVLADEQCPHQARGHQHRHVSLLERDRRAERHVPLWLQGLL